MFIFLTLIIVLMTHDENTNHIWLVSLVLCIHHKVLVFPLIHQEEYCDYWCAIGPLHDFGL